VAARPGARGGAVALSPAEQLAKRSQEAFRQRRKAARRAAAGRAARWAVPAALVAAAAALLYVTPVFAVRAGDIEIKGLDGWIDRNEVAEALSQDVGVPLARVNTGRTAARLEALPAVSEATVSRQWPTGLTVELVARRAAAAVPDGQEFVLLDPEAVAVARVEEAPEGLPVIEVPLTKGNERTVRAVLAVAASLPESLAGRVASIGGETEDTVTLTLDGGVTVIWGSAEDAAVKAVAVEILLKQPDAASIDVSAPESPVVRGP
jgi:cell division protein FtsQ